MRRRWTIGLGIVACVLAVAAVAAGHAAPDPLANEVHVLEDDAQDEFYYYDGYDLHHLHVREAYDPVSGERGLVFRFTLYGGFGPANASDALHVDVEASGPNGTSSVRWTTEDDQTWTASAGRVLVADVTDPGQEYPGVTADLQTFAPYQALGAQPGEALEAITMYSWADDDLRDAAPGGIYLPNSGGQAEVPLESQRHVETLELVGPHDYLEVDATAAGANATIQVDNALDNGQHVTAEVLDVAGWNASIEGPSQASIDPDGSIAFPIRAEASPDATEPQAIRVTSDLGAYRTVYLGTTDGELTASAAPDALDVDAEDPPQESPGLGALGVLVGVSGLAGAVGRRDR